MNRLHVHVAVDDFPASTKFYSLLFAAEPRVLKSDYAKWMLDDPRGKCFVTSVKPYNVLFLCTGNSARSIMAESILRKDGKGQAIQ